MTLLSLAFPLLGVLLPDWFVVVGRWVPALVSLAVIRTMRLPGGVITWWGLRPGGWRRLLAGSAVAIATLVGVYAVAAVLAAAFGLGTLQPADALGQVAVMLIPAVLMFAPSTFGEEVAWRGMLQRALASWGFWRSSSAIAGLWVLFHLPLHGVMVAQGTLPPVIVLATTVGLFPLGLFLSAAVVRFGSVWPAVFGHALPFTALNLLVGVDDLGDAAIWGVTAVTAVLMLAAAILLAPSSRQGGIPEGVGNRSKRTQSRPTDEPS